MSWRRLPRWRGALIGLAALGSVGAVAPVDYAGDAAALDAMIVANYAYLDHLPGGILPQSAVLAGERAQVHDRASLLAWAQDRLTTLADHHAITGSSTPDAWAVVPSFADLWIEQDGGGFRVDAVRADSPAAQAGVVAGDRLLAVEGVATGEAVRLFWDRLGLKAEGDRAAFAARVLAAGRRDRPRVLTVAHGGTSRTLILPNLYGGHDDGPAVALSKGPHGAVLRLGNSLGDRATVAAFDTAMARLRPGEPVEIDLTDTPSGGTTAVARGIMSWFVTRPTAYQVHSLPAEERETGVARQWIEQVLPRAGKHHAGRLDVRVGRWTGSMGEGLAVGLRAAGARVCGGGMAGLRGAIYDFTLPASGLVVKFPAERLATVDGIARERFVAPACHG